MRGLKQLRCAQVISAGHSFHPEHPLRPLRTRSRRTHDAVGGGCLRRADPGDLTNRDQRSRLPRLRATQQSPWARPVLRGRPLGSHGSITVPVAVPEDVPGHQWGLRPIRAAITCTPRPRRSCGISPHDRSRSASCAGSHGSSSVLNTSPGIHTKISRFDRLGSKIAETT